MAEDPLTAPAAEPSPRGDNPFTRSLAGMIGLLVIASIVLACFVSIPWTFGRSAAPDVQSTVREFEAGDPSHARLPPSWWPRDLQDKRRIVAFAPEEDLARAARQVADRHGLTPGRVLVSSDPAVVDELYDQLSEFEPDFLLGSDALGRSLLVRILVGGTISIGVGLAAALISVVIGTLYGALAGYVGGRTDALMMRVVDILYGLPYILLVVLIAVAADGAIDRWQRDRIRDASAQRSAWVEQRMQAAPEADRVDIEAEAATMFTTGELSSGERAAIDVLALLVAIGGVSWLTMARVVRGQVLSLKAQPFVESARAIGAPVPWIFRRHLLPNLLGPIIVYATLTVPQAILQESFLSFLGIGVKPPLPSWGNLAADGLSELNRHRSHWWLLFFPCLMLGVTLLGLNFVGEGLREAFDPRRARK